MLLFAILSLPYGYYQILRWVITLSSVFLMYKNFKQGYETAAFIMIIIGILFNPIFPIYMQKSTWAIFDLICASMFFAFSTQDGS